MTFLTLWVLLLSPGLCLAGVLEHICVDSPKGTSCEHENDCALDPCGDLLLVQAVDPQKPHTVPTALIATEVADASAMSRGVQLSDFRPSSPPRVNLPVPPADLPLLS